MIANGWTQNGSEMCREPAIDEVVLTEITKCIHSGAHSLNRYSYKWIVFKAVCVSHFTAFTS